MSQNIPQKPIEISEFFDERADTYEGHMKESLAFFSKFYDLISSPIVKTNELIFILDLGCGTGLELEAIFARAPNALITGVDLSEKMLSRLRDKYERFMSQIKLIKGSFEQALRKEQEYNYILSVMALHHLLPSQKYNLYEKVRNSLKSEGKYIEGAYVVSRRKEREFLSAHHEVVEKYRLSQNKIYHIDVPCSVETQIELLSQASFRNVRTIWKKRQAAIFVAEAR